MADNKQSWLAQNAGSIIGGISTIGGWLGIGEGKQDRRQIKQQGKLNDVNAKTAKELADYEQQLKLQMWKDTNYGAQLEQAGLAGVSKAAAIGGSGTGTQGASVGSVSGTGAADAASTTNARTASIQAGMQLASQLALQKAQKENIEADTANKQAGATNTNTDTEGKVIQNKINKETIDAQVQEINYKANEQIQNARIAFNKGEISEKTQQAEIQRAKNEAIGSGVDLEVKRLGMNLDRRKVNAIEESVQQGWERLILEKREVTVKELSQAAQESYMRNSTRQRGEELTQREWEAISNTAIGAVGATRGMGGSTETIKGYSEQRGGYQETRTRKNN